MPSKQKHLHFSSQAVTQRYSHFMVALISTFLPNIAHTLQLAKVLWESA